MCRGMGGIWMRISSQEVGVRDGWMGGWVCGGESAWDTGNWADGGGIAMVARCMAKNEDFPQDGILSILRASMRG